VIADLLAVVGYLALGGLHACLAFRCGFVLALLDKTSLLWDETHGGAA
jgi:hypothetical protein